MKSNFLVGLLEYNGIFYPSFVEDHSTLRTECLLTFPVYCQVMSCPSSLCIFLYIPYSFSPGPSLRFPISVLYRNAGWYSLYSSSRYSDLPYTRNHRHSPLPRNQFVVRCIQTFSVEYFLERTGSTTYRYQIMKSTGNLSGSLKNL